MDGLTQQVVTLTHKVDALYEIITQLTHQVSDHLSSEETPNLSGEKITQAEPDFPQTRRGLANTEHKDILMDDEYIETTYYSREPSLTADIQIQRLTAQLTAAYNRIATLEEQLLSQRVHFQS